MGIDVGRDFAKRFSDAHENGASNQPDLEKKMDLYNNEIGIDLAWLYPNTYKDADFVRYVRQKADNGFLRRIVNNQLVASDRTGSK